MILNNDVDVYVVICLFCRDDVKLSVEEMISFTNSSNNAHISVYKYKYRNTMLN